MKKRGLMGLLAAVLTIALMSTAALGAVMWTVDGDWCGPDLSVAPGRVYLGDNSADKIDANPVFVPDPTGVDLDLHQYESDTEVRVFNEEQLVGVVDLAVDGGTYTGLVASHLIHQEPTPDDGSDPIRGRGCIMFDAPIVGIITSDAGLDATDATLGLASVDYPTGQNLRGLEMGAARSYQDLVEVDWGAIRIDLQSAEMMDQIRVLTEAVNPLSIVKLADAAYVYEGDTITYTYYATNNCTEALLDVTVVDSALGPVILTEGLTDEDGDTLLDDLAGGATASGTLQYVVPEYLEDPYIVNTATACAWIDGFEVCAESWEVVVRVIEQASIEIDDVMITSYSTYNATTCVGGTFVIKNESGGEVTNIGLGEVSVDFIAKGKKGVTGLFTGCPVWDASYDWLDPNQEQEYWFNCCNLVWESGELTDLSEARELTAVITVYGARNYLEWRDKVWHATSEEFWITEDD